jgi:protoheme IX farnesyltransferase
MENATNIAVLPETPLAVGGEAAPSIDVPRPSLAADFYELTKPRMNLLVVITTAVGYYLAGRGPVSWVHLMHTLLGTAMTAAGASVLNQFIERQHDAKMPRTRNRPLPAGRLEPATALCFGLALGIGGVTYLALAVNTLTAALGLFTLLSYVLVYTPLKRVTSLNTVIGAVPGAIPPVMGFTAIDGALSSGALALFTILFLWQMPHFLAIAVLYRDDYAAGGFKMLPNVDPGLSMTRRQVIVYSLALIPATLLPVALGIAASTYFAAATLLGLAFLTFGISLASTASRSDARKLFLASIIYLPVLLGFMMGDKI